jgi:hypothetical protein
MKLPMYDYIFAVWYQLFEKLRSDNSRFQATLFVMVAIMFHWALVAAIVKDLGFFHTFFNQAHGNKYYFLPFAILFIYIIERIYKKRGQRVIGKYKDRNICTWANILSVVSLTIIPIVIAINLLTKG